MWTNDMNLDLTSFERLKSMGVTIVDYWSVFEEYELTLVALQALEYKAFALISDVLKLITLHKYGGLYIDLDVEILNFAFLNTLHHICDFYSGQLFLNRKLFINNENNAKDAYIANSIIGSK